ncbi:hypothetical protein NU688_33145 [Variovorax sp. ZS18.2.2]|uniref:hypothetical protein n=1 Tax=Variovorax sp. ZS18.2.2 TaxID=2971255 RepID=UPI00215148E0|nr:hypothetical protein [Variovorax sp. ZS18.2.2]MCR6481045.1 hypothetical protein [Variovorax sp. ZS18.2.2]
MTTIAIDVTTDINTLTGTFAAQQKFELGTTALTRGVCSLIATGKLTPLPFILRHASGDWGDLCEEDRSSNEAALKQRGRLMSSYKLDDKQTLWIITEWDRSVTTLLLPSEY